LAQGDGDDDVDDGSSSSRSSGGRRTQVPVGTWHTKPLVQLALVEQVEFKETAGEEEEEEDSVAVSVAVNGCDDWETIRGGVEGRTTAVVWEGNDDALPTRLPWEEAAAAAAASIVRDECAELMEAVASIVMTIKV